MTVDTAPEAAEQGAQRYTLLRRGRPRMSSRQHLYVKVQSTSD